MPVIRKKRSNKETKIGSRISVKNMGKKFKSKKGTTKRKVRSNKSKKGRSKFMLGGALTSNNLYVWLPRKTPGQGEIFNASTLGKDKNWVTEMFNCTFYRQPCEAGAAPSGSAFAASIWWKLAHKNIVQVTLGFKDKNLLGLAFLSDHENLKVFAEQYVWPASI